MSRLSALLQPSQVLLDVEAASKAALLEYIGQQVQVLHGLDAQRVSRSLSLREQVIPAYLPVKYFQLPKHCLTRVQPCL